MRKCFNLLWLVSLLFVYSGVLAQSTATPSTCPPSQFTEWGNVGIVSPGAANNVRANPTTSANLVGRLNAGDTFFVQYVEPVCADGYLWREVSTIDFTGWTVEIPVGETDPFLLPFTPETIEVSELQADGSLQVDAAGVTFTIPAALGVDHVTLTPEIGLFGEVMGARPSSIRFALWIDEEDLLGTIEIYPYAVSDATYDLLGDETLESLLDESVVLVDFVGRPPQTPLAGAAALFFGAPQHLAFVSGEGLRYLTFFAQDYVLFEETTAFEYLYRGISTDEDFLITAQDFFVNPPIDTIPSDGSYDDVAYGQYLNNLEANLAVAAPDAYTPNLAQLDAIFASLTITDAEALLRAIP